MKSVTIYTDGACSGNPGPGGWGAVLIYGKTRTEIGGGEGVTTNNRMELTAAIKALECLNQPCQVELYSDSSYLVDSHVKGWLLSWEKENWTRRKGKEQVPNSDLWQRLRELESIHSVSWLKVSGHAGVEENECCDKIATSWAKQFKE
jgi:ribonuclease HI